MDLLANSIRNIKAGEKIVYYVGQSGYWQSSVSQEVRDAVTTARDMNLAHFLQRSLGGGKYEYFIQGR